MKAYLIRGVPASLQQDGWWMDSFERRPRRHLRVRRQRHSAWLTVAGLLLLTALLIAGTLLDGQEGFPERAGSLSLEVNRNCILSL